MILIRSPFDPSFILYEASAAYGIDVFVGIERKFWKRTARRRIRSPTRTQRAAFAPACFSFWVFSSSPSSICALDHSGKASKRETWASRGATAVAWPSDRCRRTPSSGALTALPPLMSVGHPRPYVLKLKLFWSVSFGHRLSRCSIPSQALYIVWYGQSEIEAPYGRKILLFHRAFSRVCPQRSVCCCIAHIVILNWEKKNIVRS